MVLPAPPRGIKACRTSCLSRIPGPMWDQPYLETCCRSALHRLMLAGAPGRPDGLKDGPCLRRLAEDGLAWRRDDGRYEVTAAGLARHALEIQAA